MKTLHPPTLWRRAALASAAGAALSLAACGGGGGTSDTPPTPTPPTPPAGPTTQELVQAYVQASDLLLAQRMPDGGAERYALVDGCYLGNGNTKAMLVANWSAAQAQNSAHLLGRKMANVQVLAERKTTNADGSARHEVDIGYDEKYTDGTTVIGQTETVVAGSTSGACATPQTGDALRALGNGRVAAVALVSRDRLRVLRKLADGTPGSPAYRLHREVVFNLTDPAKVATYAVVSWAPGQAGAAPLSLKLLSPRIARDAAEMQGLPGNASYADNDTFRNCLSNTGNTEASAATADCTRLGVGGNAWGPSTTQLNAQGFAAADAAFASLGLDKAGAEVTFALYADDGWKSVNGQQGKTPVATYTLKIKNPAYPLAQLPAESYPMFNTLSPAEADIVAAFKAGGGTAQATLQAATPPAGGLPMARSSLYSYRQGPKDAAAAGPARVRTASIPGTVAADGKTATLPFGGKPDGASATNYAEFGLGYTDRNGRDIQYTLEYQ